MALVDYGSIYESVLAENRKLRQEIERLRAEADPEALQIVYWHGYYRARDEAKLPPQICDALNEWLWQNRIERDKRLYDFVEQWFALAPQQEPQS